MPALSERDLSNVEKIFSATQGLLHYTREKKKFKAEEQRRNQRGSGTAPARRSAAVEEALPLPVLSPSAVLGDTLTARCQAEEPRRGSSLSGTALPGTTGSSTTAAGSSVPNPAVERRLWAELAFVFWRISGLSKLSLLSYVTSDPRGTLHEVAVNLLDYLQEVFYIAPKARRLEELSKLGAHHVLFLLKNLCSRKLCILMLGGDTTEGTRLHESVCAHIVQKHHLAWMSLIFVAFVDEAATRDAARLYMPSEYVRATGNVLRCLYYVCAENTACARQMLYSEPVASITYMMYGLKQRIQRGALLRPHEADEATLLSEGGPERPVSSAQMFPRRRSTLPPMQSHHFELVGRYNEKRLQMAVQATAAFASAHAAAELAGSPISAAPPDPSAAGPSPAAPDTQAAAVVREGSSWGFNLPGLTRRQLGNMIIAGRHNCFDEMNHLALDVVVVAVGRADEYLHWAVLSTISSMLALSTKGFSDAAKQSGKQVTEIAMRENGLDVVQLLIALARGIAVEPRTDESGADVATPTTATLPSAGTPPAAQTQQHRRVANAVVRGSAEAMIALQQKREMFLQEMFRLGFTTNLQTSVYAAPALFLADNTTTHLILEFCSLDKQMGGASAMGPSAAGNNSFERGDPRKTSFAASNMSFQSTTAGAADGNRHLSFSLATAGPAARRPPNLSLASRPRLADVYPSPVSPQTAIGQSPFGAATPRAEKRNNASSAGSTGAKGNFAKSFFKSFFGGKKMGSLADLHHDLESEEEGGGAGGSLGSMPARTGGPQQRAAAAAEDDELGRAQSSYLSSTTRRLASEASTRWSDVPSYVALARELLTTLNQVLVDPALPIELRVSLGCVPPVVCMRDALAFELYEGRLTLRNMLRVLVDQVRRVIAQTGCSPRTVEGTVDERLPVAPTQAGLSRASSELLETQHFLGFVKRALFSVEQAYKVIRVSPLTGEAVALTELPLYFFCTDSSSDVAVALERLFTCVVSLWSTAIMAAECDEDMDHRSMEVLMGILQRAMRRGSIPKDGGLVGGNEFTAVSSGGGGGTSMATLRQGRSMEGQAGGPANMQPSQQQQQGDLVGRQSSDPTSEAAVIQGLSSTPMDLGGSLFGGVVGAGFFPSLGPGSPVIVAETAVSEHTNTLAALSQVCATLLHRQPTLLTTEAIGVFFALFFSHDSSMNRLGRECVCATFEFRESYGAYARMINKIEDDRQVSSLAGLLATYVSSDALDAETRHERRMWLFTSGCVTAVIKAIVRCLQRPHEYASTFVKLVPQFFRLLSAFEPSQDMSPQLSETDFLEMVSDSVPGIDGAEYFIIFVQSMFDAATCNYGLDRATSTYSLSTVGNFRLSATNCAAVKPIFLELLPALALHAGQRDPELYKNIIDVFAHIIRFTGNMYSPRLVEFAMENHLTDLLPYMELPSHVLDKLPFTGASTMLRSFWLPILTHAPQRSEIRFSATGGVSIQIDSWPAEGVTFAFYIKYESKHTNMPLMEMRSLETAEQAEVPATLSVSGGDSVQFQYDNIRTTVNQTHAPQNFKPGVWIHVAVVLSARHYLTVFLNGFHVGVISMPYFTPGTAAGIHIGLPGKAVSDAFFSIGEIVVWASELSGPEIEAHMAGSDPLPQPPKILPQEIPRTLSGSNALEPINERIARFVPYQNDNSLLLNLVDRMPPFPITAKVVGRHTAPPRRGVNYHLLWATRGGILRMIDWLDEVDTPEDVEVILMLIAETTRRVTLLSTVDARMYLLLDFVLKCNTRLLTRTGCDHLLHLGTAEVTIHDETHHVVINRLLFEYVLSDCAVFAKMPLQASLYILDKIAAMFNPALCRHAKHNARFIMPHRFIDSLMNTLVAVAVAMPVSLRMAVVNVAKQVLQASDMESSVVSIFTAMAAQLTPTEQVFGSRYNPNIKVTLPSLQHTRVHLLPFRTAENLVVLLLRSLIECSALCHSLFASSFPRAISLSWLVSCLGRFADPVAVVYAVWLFFDAMQSSPALHEEVEANQATLIEALQPHAVHTDLVLVLLTVTLGASKRISPLSQRFSLHEQLDSVLSSFTATEPNALVAPIFVKTFIAHLAATVAASSAHHPLRDNTKGVLLRHQKLSYRVRRYFSLARVCSRLMLLINLKRYRVTVKRHMTLAQRRNRAGSVSLQNLGASPTPLRAPDNLTINTSFVSTDMATRHDDASSSFARPATNNSISGMYSPADNTSFPAITATPMETAAEAQSINEDSASTASHPSDGRPRIRSAKYRRAFAVLRVCVLLWIPTLVKRYGWIFRARKRLTDQELAVRNGGTLFIVRAFRKFALQPSLYYTFVSSPVQTAALSGLVNYVSKPVLGDLIMEWERFLATMSLVPLRDGSEALGGEEESPITVANTRGAASVPVASAYPTSPAFSEASHPASLNSCPPVTDGLITTKSSDLLGGDEGIGRRLGVTSTPPPATHRCGG